MAGATAVNDREEVPDPAREALDEPRLDADDLEREIGDSEEWDEASEDDGSELPQKRHPKRSAQSL
jgi:hypothetical protein